MIGPNGNLYISVVGATGSGKGTFIRELQRLLQPHYVIGSTILSNEFRAEGLAVHPYTYRIHAHSLSLWEGPDAIAHRCIDKVKDITNTVIIFDGSRSLSTIDTLKAYYQGLVEVGIQPAALEVRLQRVRHRDKLKKRDLDIVRELMEHEMRESPYWGMQLSRCIQRSQYKIAGSLSLNDFIMQCYMVAHNIKSTAGWRSR